MTDLVPAIVLFGDVVDSRLDPGSSGYLRALRADLHDAYGVGRLAPVGFTQGDEIQLLLAPGADPFRAVLRAGLHPDARELRWAVVAGLVEPGPGPATERTGPAYHAARDLLDRAKARHEGLLAQTGDAAADGLLADLGPLLPALLAALTVRQREIGRLLLVDGIRRSEAAERLGVSRATVSVIAERGRIRHLGRLASALGAIFHEGAARADEASDDPGAAEASPARAGSPA